MFVDKTKAPHNKTRKTNYAVFAQMLNLWKWQMRILKSEWTDHNLTWWDSFHCTKLTEKLWWNFYCIIVIIIIFSCVFRCVMFVCVTQEREGRKDMEPRSEDAQFEDVAVQQLPQVRSLLPQDSFIIAFQQIICFSILSVQTAKIWKVQRFLAVLAPLFKSRPISTLWYHKGYWYQSSPWARCWLHLLKPPCLFFRPDMWKIQHRF